MRASMSLAKLCSRAVVVVSSCVALVAGGSVAFKKSAVEVMPILLAAERTIRLCLRLNDCCRFRWRMDVDEKAEMQFPTVSRTKRLIMAAFRRVLRTIFLCKTIVMSVAPWGLCYACYFSGVVNALWLCFDTTVEGALSLVVES